MTAKELKNALLQEAVYGKLVPQIVTEGNARDLLEEIRKEKAKLVKKGKLKKEKPLPEITEEDIPFDIPENWCWCRWGDLSYSIQYGYNASAKDKGRIKMVRISDIQGNEVIWDSVPYCDIKEDEIKTYLLKENDILFARTGGTVGKSLLVKNIPCEAIYAGYLIRTHYNSTKLVPEFLKLFMESDLYWSQLKEGTIATAQPNCNGQTLSKMIIPLPPLAEQKRIIAAVEQFMPLIEEYGKKESELNGLNKEIAKKLKNAILQEAVQGKLVPQDPDDEPASVLLERIRKGNSSRQIAAYKKQKPITTEEIPFDIPDNWMWVRLGEISSLVTKGTTPRGGNVAYKDKGIGFLRAENIAGIQNLDLTNLKYIDEKTNNGYLKRSILKENDLLVTIAGTLGRTAIVRKEYLPLNANQAVSIIRLIDSNLIDLNYLAFALNAPDLQEKLIGQTKVTAIPNLTLEIISHCEIPLPPLSEQKRIVSTLEKMLPLCEKIEL